MLLHLLQNQLFVFFLVLGDAFRVAELQNLPLLVSFLAIDFDLVAELIAFQLVGTFKLQLHALHFHFNNHLVVFGVLDEELVHAVRFLLRFPLANKELAIDLLIDSTSRAQ